MRERIVRTVAGFMVLLSVGLSYGVNIQWLWLSVFVGVNLIQSSFTGFCPLEKILDWRKVK
ncbi:MAG: DUF2892 domain-containing protein [Cyclobacteriaceae bacterium]|nr:DUF2892 domain-containing protein [Cyclobacteriaceae bacterium]